MGEEGGRKKGVKFRRTIQKGVPARLYVAIKFNVIILTSCPGTKPWNKQSGTCYIPKVVDLRFLFYFI